jgi:hypothetical protein
MFPDSNAPQDYNSSDFLQINSLVTGRGDETEISGESSNPPVLTEVPEDEFPLYFAERDSRLFHSHDTSPYPLPADTPEQEVD